MYKTWCGRDASVCYMPNAQTGVHIPSSSQAEKRLSTIMSMANAIVGALWQGQAGGKLAVMGSVAMFDDKWLDSEDNSKIMDWLFRWLKQV